MPVASLLLAVGGIHSRPRITSVDKAQLRVRRNLRSRSKNRAFFEFEAVLRRSARSTADTGDHVGCETADAVIDSLKGVASPFD